MSVAVKGEAGGEVGRGTVGYPTERELAIYEAICVANRPCREVGREFALAATTVRNLALQTQRTLARKQLDLYRLSSPERLRAQLAQLEYHQQQLMESWRLSREDARTVVEKMSVEGEVRIVTRKSQYGNPRYLEAMRRLMSEIRAVEAELRQAEQEERAAMQEPPAPAARAPSPAALPTGQRPAPTSDSGPPRREAVAALPPPLGGALPSFRSAAAAEVAPATAAALLAEAESSLAPAAASAQQALAAALARSAALAPVEAAALPLATLPTAEPPAARPREDEAASERRAPQRPLTRAERRERNRLLAQRRRTTAAS